MFSLSRRPKAGRRSPLWRRLKRNQEGTAAIEFAILVMPFLAIVGLIMETGFQAYSAASLDDALRRASRGLQVGSVQSEGRTLDDFRADVCRLMPGWMSCAKLVVDVRSVRLFSDMDMRVTGPGGVNIGRTYPIADDQKKAFFCPGAPGSLMLVRGDYPIPTLFGFWITSPASKGYVITSAHTFRTEPFTGRFAPASACSSTS